MAICPFAVKKLIPPGSSDPRITVTQAILHVDAGNAYDLYGFFNGPSGGIESHFHIAKDGTIFQYRDTVYEADANSTANSRAISIETQGYGDGEWTKEQLDSIKRLLLWIHQTHDVPLQVCKTHSSPGIGYHTLFGAPSPWTPFNKSCPGNDRKPQFHNELVPWFSTAGQEKEEDDMQLNDDIYPGKNRELTVGQLFQRLDRQLTRSANREKRLIKMIKDTQKMVDENADKKEIRQMLNRVEKSILEELNEEESA